MAYLDGRQQIMIHTKANEVNQARKGRIFESLAQRTLDTGV